MTVTQSIAERVLDRLTPGTRAAVAEQTLVTAAQVLAGIGNLAFTIAAARILDPAGFARLAAFLALFLLVHLPTGSLSAAGALEPSRAPRLLRQVGVPALAGGAAVAASSSFLAPVLGLSPGLVAVLGAAIPGAVLLSLARGPLHALRMHRRVGLSLLAEPAVRLVAGVPLALAAGPEGAALGVTVAGYVAYGVAAWRIPNAQTADTAPVPPGRVGWTMASFVLLAVVFQQDLLLANARLPAPEAGIFAAISTLGGVTAFATVRIPTTLLPRALHRSREALAVAYLSTAAISVVVVLGATLAPAFIVETVFGDGYAGAAPHVPRYLAAMGLLALVRVWVTYACASGRGRTGTVVAATTFTLHLGLLVALGGDAAGVVDATLWAGAAGVGGMAAAGAAARLAPLLARRRSAAAAGALTLAALAVRLPVVRGLWLDEATSVAQARLPFGAMISDLAATDVHPPLHAAVLWVTTRIAGFSEEAIRAPSILAGTLTIPLLYACGRDLYGRRTGLVAAALGTAAPFLVWYSQEARMYAFFMLFALLAVWAQVRIRNGLTGAGAWALWTVSSALLVWTHYFGALQVLVQVGLFLTDLRDTPPNGGHRRAVTATVASLTALVFLFAPLAPFASGQMTANDARHAELPEQEGAAVSAASDLDVYAVIANGVWALLGYHSDETMAQLGALWPLGMLGALALLGRGRSRSTTFLLLLAAVPAAVLLAVGTRSRFLFEIRYFAGAVPILLLLAARAISVSVRTPRALLAITGIAVAVLGVATADEQLNRENPRIYDFRGSLAFVESSMEPGDVLVYEPKYLNDVIAYYAPSVPRVPLEAGIPEDAERVFLLGSFLDNPDRAARTGDALAVLDDSRTELPGIRDGQVKVWVFE